MRPYGSGGKYWNLGLSDHGRLGATQQQLWTLRRLTGEDHRGKGLTRDRASELIEQAIEAKEARKEGLTGVAEQFFTAVYKKAVQAANRAGDDWMRRNQEPVFSIKDGESGERVGVHGSIGAAWISWPKAGTTFHKWMMEHIYDGQKKVVRIPHRYAERLEGHLVLACERAAFEVLKSSGTSVGDIRLFYRCEGSHHLPSQAA